MMDNNYAGLFIGACAWLSLLAILIVGGIFFLRSYRKKNSIREADDNKISDVIEDPNEPMNEVVKESPGPKCAACGAENSAGNNFCEHCGTKL